VTVKTADASLLPALGSAVPDENMLANRVRGDESVAGVKVKVRKANEERAMEAKVYLLVPGENSPPEKE
jgi:hypothetical protein